MRKLTVKRGVLTRGDIEFLFYKAMSFFSIRELRVVYDPSKAKWPDIWVSPNRIPEITVTETWRRKSAGQRRTELVHECLHIKGLQHGKKGKLEYSTHPVKDSFSRKVYKDILRVMG